MKRRQRGRIKSSPDGSRRWADRLAMLFLFALFLVPPLVFSPSGKESFRLPKELFSEPLALASLFFLAFRLRPGARAEGSRGPLRSFLAHPAVLAIGPFLLVASLSLLVTEHPEHGRRAMVSLLVGGAVLIGWSLGLTSAERRRLLGAMIFPALVLALLAILQYHGFFQPFEFSGQVGRRLGLTSLAGGAFDLAAYLILPALLAQLMIYRATSRGRRVTWGIAGGTVLYALALTQTLTTLAALGLASLVLWSFLLPRRRMVLAVAVLTVLVAGAGLGFEPLRERLDQKLESLTENDVNDLLTGRLDGWRAAVFMLENHPFLGVGPGAFTTEFADAKLALAERGVSFYRKHRDFHFASAHNEFLEVGAEVGLAGLLALLGGLGVVLRHALRKISAAPEAADDPAAGLETALLAAGLTALGVMALTSFPMHLAIVAFPYLLLLSDVLDRPAAPTATQEAGDTSASGIGSERLFTVTAIVLAVAVVLSLRHGAQLWRADRLVAAVEVMTLQTTRRGALPRRMGDHHLRLLREAEELDPAKVDVLVAQGWQYLGMGRPGGALRAFDKALELEPRAEVYANLAQAHLAEENHAAAQEAARKARVLDPHLDKRLPPSLRRSRP